jgi:AcrR family transcriptional regulator
VTPAENPGTRERIVSATIETLRTVGYPGTTARAIARAGGFNQALIYYHFGGIHAAMLAAVDRVSEERMTRYRESLAGIADLGEFATVAFRLYREDMEVGHTTVLVEVMAAVLAEPGLGAEVIKRMDAWVAYAEELIGGFLRRSPFASVLGEREIAQAVIAMYLGMETLTHLDGDRQRFDRLFEAGRGMAQMMAPLFSAPGTANDGGDPR